MWSLGKVIDTPEHIPVYVGSFGDNHKLKRADCKDLFKCHSDAIAADMQALQREWLQQQVAFPSISIVGAPVINRDK